MNKFRFYSQFLILILIKLSVATANADPLSQELCNLDKHQLITEVTSLDSDQIYTLCLPLEMNFPNFMKVIVVANESQITYRPFSRADFFTCFSEHACKIYNGQYLEVSQLNKNSCKFFESTFFQSDQSVINRCYDLGFLNQMAPTESDKDEGKDQLNDDKSPIDNNDGVNTKPEPPIDKEPINSDKIVEFKTKIVTIKSKIKKLHFDQQTGNTAIVQTELNDNNEMQKGAFSISLILLLFSFAVLSFFVCLYIYKKKRANESETPFADDGVIGEAQDKFSLMKKLGNKFLILITILGFVFMANLLLTVFTGIAAFGLSSCECTSDKMFCNRMISVSGTDEKLQLHTKRGYCVSIKNLKLESGFSCKGGNSEYDDLKAKCRGTFLKVEQDICSHWCPLGQKKGLCQTMEFNIEECNLIDSIGYDVDMLESLGTLTTSVEIKPECANYVRKDGKIYCAGDKLNTISSIDDLNFFEHEPGVEELETICLTKGFINPNSVSCHYLWEVGETKFDAIQPQIKFNFIATFDGVDPKLCTDDVKDFYCSNTPVVGNNAFNVIANCYDETSQRIVSVEEEITGHCNCMWCLNGVDNYPCNQIDKLRNSTIISSNGEPNEGANSKRSSKSTWLWIILSVSVVVIVIIIICSIIGSKSK